MAFEEELNALVQRTKVNDENPSRTASYETINRTLSENKKRHEIWMNDVDIFYNKYLKKHPLGQKIDTWLFQRNYDQLVAALESISGDKDFINKMNGISMVSVPKYQLWKYQNIEQKCYQNMMCLFLMLMQTKKLL